MLLSNPVIKAHMAPQKVFQYEPPKFDLGTPVVAETYIDQKKNQGSDFRMSDVIRIQTKIKEIESADLEQNIEVKVLERLKEVQEPAYQEAYQLGLDEGRKEAFQSAAQEIEMRLKKMDELINSVTNLKKDLVQFNETHLVQLTLHIAQRIAAHEISVDPTSIVQIIKNAVEMAQLEENVVIQVAPTQLEFLETLKKETGREYEFLKKVKIEPVEGIREGGCVIETNYGVIDARFEERVSKLWTALSESLFRVKDKVTAA
jgi:flagellar assembly protein FliH